MTNIGIAGIGFMGWIHYLAYQRTADARLAAICEVNPKRLAGDWRDIKGNFGPPGEEVDVSGLACYDNFDAMVADPNIDVVDICLPPSAHAAAAIKALEHGKHVFCEKPMALTTAACDEMVRAADRAGKLIMIGHVLPMHVQYQFARTAATDGRYGKLLGGHFRRVISDPLWLKDFYDPTLVGGPLLDLHIHDAHFIRLLFGMPRFVTSRGRMRGEVVEYCNSFFEFEDSDLVVSATAGVINQQGRPFDHGYEIHFEKATLLFEFAVYGDAGKQLMPLTVLDDAGDVIEPEIGASDEITPFAAEIRELLDAIQAGRPSPILGGSLARDAIVLCHKQTEAVRERKTIAI